MRDLGSRNGFFFAPRVSFAFSAFSRFSRFLTITIQLFLRLRYSRIYDCDTAALTIAIQLFLHLPDMRG